MSFDKIEVRVFSGPDQVQVGSNTKPDLVVINIGPKGDTGATGNTGPAGPNSVTSATTSDGTANLSLGDLEVVGGEIYTDGEYSHIYTQGDGAEIFTLGSTAKIYTQGADAHISTSGDSATIYTSGASGSIYTTGANAGISTAGANATMGTLGANATISTAGSAAHIQTTHASAAVKSTNFAAVESGGASLVDGSMQPCLTWSAGGRNLTIPSGTATTFNTTSYTYGTGAAAAHRTALGLTTLATTTPAANVANFLEFPTSANLASALTDENGTGGGFVRAEGATLTSPSIDGTAAFTGTTRPTSAGTGTPAATSLMTRDDVALEPFYNLGSVFRVSATPAFANSGTGSSSATQSAGDRWAGLSSGTANSGWARAQIGRGLTTVPSLSGAGINFASKLGVSIVLWIANSAATDNLNIFRLRFGSDNTPVADGVDAVAYRGFGVEIKARGSSHDWRVYGHNGTSITYSAWSNTGLGTDILRIRIFLSVMSNGSGTITASLGVNGSRTLSTITTTGGPTTTGTSAQSFIEVHVANSASGTLPLAAALYDAMFYAQT